MAGVTLVGYCLLGQNQLVVRGNTQNVAFIVMQDVYLPVPAEQLTSIHLFRRRWFLFVTGIRHWQLMAMHTHFGMLLVAVMFPVYIA